VLKTVRTEKKIPVRLQSEDCDRCRRTFQVHSFTFVAVFEGRIRVECIRKTRTREACPFVAFYMIRVGPFFKIESFGPARSSGSAATFFFGPFRSFFQNREFRPSPQLWVCGDILFWPISVPFSGIQSFGPARTSGSAATFFFVSFAQSAALWVCSDILFWSFSVLFPERTQSCDPVRSSGSAVSFFFGHFRPARRTWL